MKKTIVVAACLAAVSFAAVMAQKPNTKSETETVKATIDSIDHDARTVTFKDKDGNLETVYAGPEIKRFDELKVGDEVTFRYTASVAVRVRKPGDPVVPSTTEKPVLVRGTGEKPSGTITQQQTANVLVKSIDPKTSAITVETEDGRSMSFKVEEKGLIKNIKTGDRVEITYTEALMISVQ